MLRPCFLVIDREFAGSISTRKLVIETAKFNVITAYSSVEAVATLNAFPAVNAAVLDASMPHLSCSELIQALRNIVPTLPIIVVGSPGAPFCVGANHYLESFDPKNLLATLQKLVPQQNAMIQEHDVDLRADEDKLSM